MPQPSLGCQVKTEASWPSCRTEFGNSIRRATSTLSATSNTEGLSGVRLIPAAIPWENAAFTMVHNGYVGHNLIFQPLRIARRKG